MNRLEFLQRAGLVSAGLMVNVSSVMAEEQSKYISKRPAVGERNFSSKSVEGAIKEFRTKVKDQELAWLFENCFPNTLDTTVFVKSKGNNPDTYIITGDGYWVRIGTGSDVQNFFFDRNGRAVNSKGPGVGKSPE